jgi:hypothetical protein
MSRASKDPQARKAYAWEDRFLLPLQRRAIAFDDAQQVVDGIFIRYGWRYPPRVRPLPKQCRRREASANRVGISLPPVSPDWIVCHEVAHSLTCTVDGKSDEHGADWLGLYLKLLDQVCGMPIPMLMYTLKDTGLAYNLTAKPWFTAS